jgi:hypothetical protein
VTSYEFARPRVTLATLLALASCSPDLSLLNDDVSFGGGDAGGAASSGSHAGIAGKAPDAAGANAGGAGDDPKPEGGAGPLPEGGTDAGGVPSAGAASVCMPSGAETCNGKDDDCSGVIDEGCPSGVSTTFEKVLPALGDSPGGGVFADDCKHGQVLAGVSVRMGLFLAQVQGICRQVTLALSSSAPLGYGVELSDVAPLEPHPAMNEDTQTQLACPENEAMVGLKVSEQHVTVGDDPSVTIIPRVWVSCAKLTLVKRGDDSLAIAWEGLKELAPASGSISAVAPPGLVATRLHGASGSWVDRVGFGVSKLEVVTAP